MGASELKRMERRVLSVGFADMANFARASQFLGAERTAEMLDEAYRVAGDAIVAHGGTIWKYIGDAILFTVDSPREAVRAAEAIVAAFRREIGSATVFYRVGVATGDVVIAEVGHPSHRAKDLFGETVNRAARLVREAGTKPTGVALCDETRKCLE